MRDNPRHSEDPLDCLERARDIGPTTCAVKEKDVLGNFDAFAKTAGTVKGSTLLDLSDYYCRDGICPSVIGGVTVYRDITHLTDDLLQDAGSLHLPGARRPRGATRREVT